LQFPYQIFFFFILRGKGAGRKARVKRCGAARLLLNRSERARPIRKSKTAKSEVPVESICDGRRSRRHRDDDRPRVAPGNAFSRGLRSKDPRQFSSSESVCNRAAWWV